MAKKRSLNPLSTVKNYLVPDTGFTMGASAPTKNLSEINDRFLGSFPSMRSGKSFIGLSMAAMKSVPKFGVITAWVACPEDQCDPANDSDQDQIEKLFQAATIIDPLVRNKKGMWGALDTRTLGCFFPGKDQKVCEAIAAQMRYDLSGIGKESVLMGIADYPANGFLKGQVLDNAKKALMEARMTGPGSIISFNPVSLNISGDELYEKGEIDWAVQEFKMALIMDPVNLNVINSLGVCYGVLGLYKEALDEFKKAIKIDPAQIMAIYNAGFVCARMKDHLTALDYFRKAESIGQNVFEVSFQMGKLHLEMGNPEKGRDCFEKAAKERPEHVATSFCLGECYAATGMPDEAALCYKKAVKTNPGDARSLSALGHLYETYGKNLDIAEMFCKESVKISPENGLFRHRLGRIYFHQKRFENALAEFKKAGELGHDSIKEIEKIKGGGK